MTALIILLSFILLITVLMFIPVFFIFDNTDIEKITIKYGIFKIRLKKTKDKKSSAKDKKIKRMDFKSLLNNYKSTEKIKDAFEFLGQLLEKLKKFNKHIIFKVFKFSLTVSGENAAETAIRYGTVNSLAYPLYNVFLNTFRTEHTDFEIDADFDSKKSKFSYYLKIKATPFYFLKILIASSPHIIKFYKGVKNNER